MDRNLEQICRDIRCDIISSIGHVGVGHIGGSLSIVEVLAVLYFSEMNIDPENPKMPGRDRLICSKGHAGPAVYAALANRGYFPREALENLNAGGTWLPSHCDMQRTPGIDMTTGSLGQGFSCAMGVALGSKIEKDGATIYTIIGDGESQEGQIWEAAMFASSKQLDNLIAFTDYNKLQIDDCVAAINGIEPLADKWAAFGWNVINVTDGNDVHQVLDAVRKAKGFRGSRKPTMVILNTVKGKGAKSVEDMGTASHNAKFTREQAEQALREVRGCC